MVVAEPAPLPDLEVAQPPATHIPERMIPSIIQPLETSISDNIAESAEFEGLTSDEAYNIDEQPELTPPSWLTEPNYEAQEDAPRPTTPESSPKNELDWVGFTAFCGEQSGFALQALLKNAIPLEYQSGHLRIGCQNPDIFTAQRKDELEQLGKLFMGNKVRITFEASNLAQEESITAKDKVEKEEADQSRRERARTSNEVITLQKQFANSMIEGIIFKEEK